MLNVAGLCGTLVGTSRCSRCLVPWHRQLDQHVRRFSSEPHNEHISVRVGGSGNVNINLSYPAARNKDLPSTLLVHLPTGPTLSSNTSFSRRIDEHFTSLQAKLMPGATLARIEYRLSEPRLITSKPDAGQITYPQPIHDVTTAFRHLVDQVLTELFEDDKSCQIALSGAHIGGALASMLALTHPDLVDAVFAIEPLTDWVILDELARVKEEDDETTRKRSSKQSDKVLCAPAAKRLLDIRTQLFRTPSAYFDPFASPTLFLRAPGRDTPRTHAEALGLIGDEGNEDWVPSNEYENDHRDDPGMSTIDSTPSSVSYGPYDDDQPHSQASVYTDSPLPLAPKQIRRRKVLRRWPSTYSSSTLPPLLPEFNIFLASQTLNGGLLNDKARTDSEADESMRALFHAQGTEFADLLKRACFFGRDSGIAEQRVRLRDFTSPD